jgi:adenylylsulfate kinase-like enzyme
MVINLIGQPGSGKSVQSHMLQTFFKYEMDEDVIIIDGDDMREIFNNKDYSINGRIENIKKAYDIAYFLHTKGFVVILAMVSPFSNLREDLQNKVGKQYYQFYLHTTDIRGREQYHFDGFEVPSANHIDTTNKTIKETYEEIRTLYREMANMA